VRQCASDSEDGDEVAEQRICTTTTVTRIVARDDARELSIDVGTSHQKRRFNYSLVGLGPNLLYKILFLRNHNYML